MGPTSPQGSGPCQPAPLRGPASHPGVSVWLGPAFTLTAHPTSSTGCPLCPLPGWVQTGRSLLLREAAPRGLEHVFPDVQGAQPLLKPELQPVTGQGH